jgi:hypothetical protein
MWDTPGLGGYGATSDETEPSGTLIAILDQRRRPPILDVSFISRLSPSSLGIDPMNGIFRSPKSVSTYVRERPYRAADAKKSFGVHGERTAVWKLCTSSIADPRA